MSVEGSIFKIGVVGSRERIIRMMNAAICNAGSGKVITEGDDIAAINLKLGEFIGKDGKNIGTVDLLDETAKRDKEVQKKKKAFEDRIKACKNCPFECPNAKRDADFVAPKDLEGLDEEEYYAKERAYCPWDDPYDAENIDPDDLEPARYLEVIGVEDGPKDNYTARFSYYVYECYGPDDYLHWDDIARLYNCCVWFDSDYYRNGRLMRFEAATIYEPIDGNVKTTRLESGTTEEEYDTFIETLAERYPDFYRPVRDEYFKKKAEEKDRVRLQKERGIKIHYTVWHNFASWEEDGTKAIRCTYAAHLEEAEKKNAWLTKEDLETVMNLRKEKWEGVNDGLANCYMNLLMDLYDEDQWAFTDFIDANGHAAIPDSLTEISEFAFDGCTELLSVDIPGSVKVIYTFAFNGCTNLKSVVIQEGVEEIKAGAFEGCTSLTDVILPKSLKQVSFGSFENCPCINDLMVRYPHLFSEEKRLAEEQEKQEEPEMGFNELIDDNGHAVIPDGATEIEECAFVRCRNLVRIDIPESVRVIYYGAFLGCTGLTSIVIPEGVEEIQECTFMGCTALKDVTLPKSLKRISFDAFEGCPCEEAVMKECEARSIII